MSIRIQLISIFIGLIVFSFILELVRRKKLREEYSLLWLFSGAMMIIIPLWKDGLFFVARLFGVADATALLFLFGILFVFLFTVHLSVALSELKEDRERLAMEMAFLRHRLKQVGNPFPAPEDTSPPSR